MTSRRASSGHPPPLAQGYLFNVNAFRCALTLRTKTSGSGPIHPSVYHVGGMSQSQFKLTPVLLRFSILRSQISSFNLYVFYALCLLCFKSNSLSKITKASIDCYGTVFGTEISRSCRQLIINSIVKMETTSSPKPEFVGFLLTVR